MATRRHSRALRLGLWLVALVALAWVGGFAVFVSQARAPATLPPHADGIVALTGGAARIPAALELLRQGLAERLLISGVGTATTRESLLAGSGLDAGAWADRITLGREATTTAGNAAETADWVQAHGLHSLIVVTAAYHMDRALAEIGHAAPELTLYPVPVTPPGFRAGDLASLRLLVGEYNKLLAAELGLGRLAPGGRG